MSTTRYAITSGAWTKIAGGSGRKLLRKGSGGEVLLHVGPKEPKLDSPHHFAMAPREEFELVGGESMFARAKDGSAEIVAIG